jgi:hypothetical protein
LNSPSSSNKSVFAKTFSLGICNWAATGCFQTHTIGYYLLSHNFIFLQWPYQRVHIFCAPQYTNGTYTLSENNNNSFSLVNFRMGLCTRWYKREQERNFQQPLNHWTWLIASQQITNNSSKSITLQVPKFTAKTSGSWLCQQSRIQSWR